jgi:hypothetical protein
MGPEEQPEEIGHHRLAAMRYLNLTERELNLRASRSPNRLDLWQMAEEQNRRLVLAEKELAEVRDKLQAVIDRFPVPGDHLGGGVGC